MSIVKKPIKRILLIRPPTTLPVDIKHQGIGEPLGILYIAATLRQCGYDVHVLDCSAVDLIVRKGKYVTYGDDHVGIKRKIEAMKPDLIGVSCFVSASEFDLFETCQIIKRCFRYIPIVVGGTHPSMFPQRMLAKPYIDYVIMGEGELRFKYLLEALNRHDRDFRFDGIAYRKSGKVVVNPCNSWIEDLDGLPYPARDLVDMNSYWEFNKKYNLQAPHVKGLVLATRGCFNSCAYCAEHKHSGKKIRARSIPNIMGEIDILNRKYGVSDILFVDNNLVWNKSYMKDLCLQLQSRALRPSIPVGVWPNMLDGDVVEAMAKAGFKSISLSIGSASKRVLKEIMHRNVDLDLIPRLIKVCKENGLKTYGSFVLGMIGEERKEILRSLAYPFKVGLDGVEFYVAFPLPGTDLFKEAKAKGYLPQRINYRKVYIENIDMLRIPQGSSDYVFSSHEMVGLIRECEKLFKDRSSC